MRLVTIAVALIAAAAFALDAQGQCRSFGGGYVAPYRAPTYNAYQYQAPAVLLYPAIQFQYNASNDPRLFDPRFAPTPVQPAQPGGFGSFPSPQQPARTGAPPAGQAPARLSDDLPALVEGPVSEAPAQASAQRVAWEQAERVRYQDDIGRAAHGVLKAKCASCHTYPGKTNDAGEQVFFFDAQGNWSASLSRKEAIAPALSNRMPPAARHDPFKALTAAEKNALQLWAALPQQRNDLAVNQAIGR